MKPLNFWEKLFYFLIGRVNLFWMRPGRRVEFLFDGKWWEADIEKPIYECSNGLLVPLFNIEKSFVDQFLVDPKTAIIPSRVRKVKKHGDRKNSS